jgi:uncharacterized cupredoxin-like copper-binding protein
MTITCNTTRPRRAGASIIAIAAGALFAFSIPAQALAMDGPGAKAGHGHGEKAGEAAEKGHGESGGHHDGMKMDGAGDHEHGAAQFSFGQPSPDAKPDRQIKIGAFDTMRFNPPKLTVDAGSVVEFVVTNNGKIAHAWSINTVDGQVEHGDGMQNVAMADMMGHMDSEPNGFVLEPGETKSLIWTFTGGGDVQYACHLPGHFPAGMHGMLTIKGGEGMKSAEQGHGEKESHGHEKPNAKEHEGH